MCLLDWGIDKILTITVDNAASNSGLISFIEKKTKHRNATILGHKYARSSPRRQNTFKLCVENEKVDFKNQLCLDVPTRWNYIYFMFEKIEKY